jgi:hypothetical protein
VNQGAHPLNSDQYKGTLNLIIGGQTVQSQNITDPGTYTFTGITGSGTQQVSAQVIDSVLYDATAATTTSFNSNSITLTITPAVGNNYTFSWNDIGSSPYSLCISTNGGSFNCSPHTSGDNKVVIGSNKKAYVVANNGTQSAQTPF